MHRISFVRQEIRPSISTKISEYFSVSEKVHEQIIKDYAANEGMVLTIYGKGKMVISRTDGLVMLKAGRI